MIYFNTWLNYAKFEGSATRGEFWAFIVINFFIKLILAGVSISLGYYTSSGEHTVLDSIFALVILIPTIALCVRRLHDINLSGWWGWLFIPFFFLMLIVGFIKTKNKQI